MKILTNVRFYQVAGITGALRTLIMHLDRKMHHSIRWVGVEAISRQEQKPPSTPFHSKIFRHIAVTVPFRQFGDILDTAYTLDDVRKAYAELRKTYKRILEAEKPDLVLVNGTYFLPWCLFEAATELGIPTVLHYHGLLSQETSHWKEARRRNLCMELERSFKRPSVYYIFPSELAKRIVETEVFGSPIRNGAVIPNAIPEFFFKQKPTRVRSSIGFVGRWTRIKNIDFLTSFAEHLSRRKSKLPMSIVTDVTPKIPGVRSGIVRLFPAMESEELAGFYSRQNVMICPSFFETYGNVAQEAIACGTPALITENMGVAETYRKLGLGEWIVPFNSPTSVYEMCQEISRSGSVTRDVRENLREIAGFEPVYRAMMSSFESALLPVLSKKKG